MGRRVPGAVSLPHADELHEFGTLDSPGPGRILAAPGGLVAPVDDDELTNQEPPSLAEEELEEPGHRLGCRELPERTRESLDEGPLHRVGEVVLQ